MHTDIGKSQPCWYQLGLEPAWIGTSWIGTSWINVQLADAVADMDEPKSAGRVFSRVVGMYGLGGCGQPTAVLTTLTEQL